ncbi:MAG: hypothetical protein U0T83_02975 [Bacteriovoracaceae bacterium]
MTFENNFEIIEVMINLIYFDFSFFKQKILWNFFIRVFYILLVVLYVFASIKLVSDFPITFIRIVEWILIALIWNIGLWVITLDFFQKKKLLATFLYLPTLITSPFLIYWGDGTLNWASLILLFLILMVFLFGESMRWPFTLHEEAKKEIYLFIDKYFKKLPKNPDGTINDLAAGFDDNDIDALRHAYVSGIFTQEYGETAADIFARLNEHRPGGGISSSNSENSKNMDLWNNQVGRKYGKQSKTKKDLFKNLMKALKEGELIIDPEIDQRKYSGNPEITGDLKGAVIVLDESKKGKNKIFFDLNKNLVMKKNEFVAFIKNGDYPNYEIRLVRGDNIPVSKKDPFTSNNLG